MTENYIFSKFNQKSKDSNRKFILDKNRWMELPSLTGFPHFQSENFYCHFTDHFSFEVIIYGKKMEKSIDKLKKYMDESHIGVDRDLNSLSMSNYLLGNNADQYLLERNSIGLLTR